MPVIEKIQNTLIPKTEAPPIPVRVVQTKMRPPTQRAAAATDAAPVAENAGQQITNSSPDADPSAPASAESVRLSPAASALARKEQAFRNRELALKERETKVEEDVRLAAEYRELKAKLSAKDFSEAEKLGLNYEEYTKFKLDQQTGEDPVRKELDELRAKIAAMEKGSQESAASQYEETVAEYKSEISKLVKDNSDFSALKALGEEGEKAVLQLILDSFEEDDDELTIMEAAELVKTKVLEQAEFYQKLLPPKEVEQPTRQLPRPMVGKTLTNSMAQGTQTSAPSVPLHRLSEAERYAEARRRVEARKQRT